MERVARIAAARAAALDALTSAAGDDSLCTLARERLPAAKYHEGAVAALGDALRASRSGAALPDSDSWGSQWSHLMHRDSSWTAYVRGGREALTHL
ncbi:hypothetical protein [Microcella sp.]|uniref:hypothetical protein n=1 Tax=Microcella sp. TaxID=1913979 RepID=UPI003F711DE1